MVVGSGGEEMIRGDVGGDRSDGDVGEKRHREDGSAVSTVNDVVVSSGV